MVKLSKPIGTRFDVQRTAAELTSFTGIELDVFIALNRSFDVQC